MKFSATPWLALWLASWQLFLFKARPLQLPSWYQWWLLAVSFVFYNNNVAWFWKIFTRLYCNLYNVLARPIASNGHIKNQRCVNRGFYWFMDHSFVIEKKTSIFCHSSKKQYNTLILSWYWPGSQYSTRLGFVRLELCKSYREVNWKVCSLFVFLPSISLINFVTKPSLRNRY